MGENMAAESPVKVYYSHQKGCNGHFHIEERNHQWDGNTIWQTKTCGPECRFFKQGTFTVKKTRKNKMQTCDRQVTLTGEAFCTVHKAPWKSAEHAEKIPQDEDSIQGFEDMMYMERCLGVCTKGLCWKVIIRNRPDRKMTACKIVDKKTRRRKRHGTFYNRRM